MRVAVVTPYDLSHEGGVNRHVQALAVALGAEGHQATVLGPASGAVPAGCHGLGGVVAPFVGIKIIDVVLAAIGLA